MQNIIPAFKLVGVKHFFMKLSLSVLLFLSFYLPNTLVLAQADGNDLFKDVSISSGLDFHHFNGMTGKFYFPEMTGQGGGFIDFDNDGDLDIYLLQGTILGSGETFKDALFPPKNTQPQDRLFRNESHRNGKGNMVIQFTDVTKQSNIQGVGYGMGMAVGDFNNDGFQDIYITNYGPNKMLFNRGDGSFEDVTQASGTGDNLWGTSCAAIDFDHDGWLDLYVTNYVFFDIAANKKCYANNSGRDYCGPSAFTSQPDRLFRNLGNGTFKDVTSQMLNDYTPGSGLGLVSLDVNNDGWLDLYVANDGQPNQLWVNQQGKSFVEDGLFSGAAVNQNGQAEASMGLAAGDFDNDGDEDLFMTHIMGETNTLYLNDGQGLFEDKTIAVGLASLSFPNTAFGVNWIDFDNDSWLDLYIANGAVLEIDKLVRAGDPYPLHQPNQLLANIAGKKFIDISDKLGDDYTLSEVSRGAATADIDNDGDLDLLITNNNGRARLLLNMVGNNKNWIGLKLVDENNGRDLLGSKAILYRKGKKPLVRRSRTEGSYCSANDPRIIFGLGETDDLEYIEVVWPDRTREVLHSLKTNGYSNIQRHSTKK